LLPKHLAYTKLLLACAAELLPVTQVLRLFRFFWQIILLVAESWLRLRSLFFKQELGRVAPEVLVF